MFNELPAVLSTHFWGIEFRLIALFLLIIAASILFKTFLADLVSEGIKRIFFHEKGNWIHRLFEMMEKPFATLVMLVGFYIAFSILPLDPESQKFIDTSFHALITIIIFWALIRATTVGAELLTERGNKEGMDVATFVPLFRKIIVFVLAIICVVVIIDNLGYSVTSIIAALGIGGAAIAFASQSTIANLYGSISIALDRPFKVGDTIKIAQTEGVVETIGLRSTLIRTPANSLVNVPNNILATEAVENLTAKYKHRIAITFGLAYGASHTQVLAVIDELKCYLDSLDKDLSSTPKQIHLTSFTNNSLQIELICNTIASQNDEMLRIQQNILIEIMSAIERNELKLAMPILAK